MNIMLKIRAVTKKMNLHQDSILNQTAGSTFQ
jgi:hypothetical protein